MSKTFTHKVGFSAASAVDDLDESMATVRAFMEDNATGDHARTFTSDTRHGVIVGLGDSKFTVSLCNGGLADQEPIGVGPVSVEELANFTFDPDADIEPHQQLYAGFLFRGDQVVWLGREKHRKSNLILQCAICGAVGRDFLGFKFVANAPLSVVLIDFESKSASLKQRCDGIASALNLNDEELALLHANLKILEVRRIRKAGRAFPKFPHKATQDASFWEELVARNPADLYIIDPLRTLHGADENDSSIETLLSEMQRVFKGAAVIAAHHMRKQGDSDCSLVADMRAFSDGGRGSSAIKAHSDVIVLQERSLDERGNEVVHLGAFLKDGPDIEPTPLMETDHETFCWHPVAAVPEYLEDSHRALRDGGGRYRGKNKAASEITKRTKASRATAYRHIDAMLRQNLVMEDAGWFSIKEVHP